MHPILKIKYPNDVNSKYQNHIMIAVKKHFGIPQLKNKVTLQEILIKNKFVF